jgi:hypothetical protein
VLIPITGDGPRTAGHEIEPAVTATGLLAWPWWVVLIPLGVGPGSYLVELAVLSLLSAARQGRSR